MFSMNKLCVCRNALVTAGFDISQGLITSKVVEECEMCGLLCQACGITNVQLQWAARGAGVCLFRIFPGKSPEALGMVPTGFILVGLTQGTGPPGRCSYGGGPVLAGL